MAGAPLDPIEDLATRKTADAARALIARRRDFVDALSEVDQFLRSRRHGLSKEEFQTWHKAVKTGILNTDRVPSLPVLAAAYRFAGQLFTATKNFEEIFETEVLQTRQSLHKHVTALLPDYLVFASESLRDLREQLVSNSDQNRSIPVRTKKIRARERHLVLYLQRICCKNDTLSRFGPAGWGTVNDQVVNIRLVPEPGIAKHESFLERWTAHGVAAALNVDPGVRQELAPRIHPNGRIQGDHFVFMDTGTAVLLGSEMLKVLSSCDGKKPAHTFGVEMELLNALADKKIIRWEVEVPAVDPYAFQTLMKDVGRWRDNPIRQRWLDLLAPIDVLAIQFRNARDPATRARIMEEVQTRLDEIGTHRSGGRRTLYAATNPIGEECLREANLVVSRNLLDEVAIDAAPWINLWRDVYAFVASRVAAGLRGVFESERRDRIPLPAFLRLCETAHLSLTGAGLVALAHVAFQEVKAAFREVMMAHAENPEYELTPYDCEFVRRRFEYPKFDGSTYPSADLQLAASSVEAVNCGDYQWVLAELHPSVALLHHGFYWSCPDKSALSAALNSTLFNQPSFYFGLSAIDFTSTTTVPFFDVLPNLHYFVAPGRPKPNWPTVSPANAEVYIDPGTGDVCARRVDNQECLGSFARNWLIPLGFHPFLFGMAPHMPRLRCGRVIVQRRAWTISLDELGQGDFTGVSRDLVLAVGRLRGARDLPRFIYIRPTEQALRRTGAEGRDKDTKPVFVDLESYLFLEIFHRWLVKAGELEVTEMLPRPDQLLWKEADGRRTFELRTQIVPRR